MDGLQDPWEDAVQQAIELAVITAAGTGTRMRPATTFCQKELLNVVDRPGLSYVLDEVARAGIPQVMIVAGIKHYSSMRAYVQGAAFPRVAGRNVTLDVSLSEPTQPGGLGQAVASARLRVDGRPFALALGDNIMPLQMPAFPSLIEAFGRADRAGAVALCRIARERSHLYGCATVSGSPHGHEVAIQNIIEKPNPQSWTHEMPLGLIGRYVLPARIFDVLDRLSPQDGEAGLSDALACLAQKAPMVGVVFGRPSYDIGTVSGMVDSVIALALERPDLRPVVGAILAERLSTLTEDPKSPAPGSRTM